MEKLATYLAYLKKRKETGPTVYFPDFPTHLTWFNSRPLIEQDLRGKITVIYFWTYCSINCLHMLGHLSKLENKYANQPVLFIGVHSPKFPNEKNDKNIESALLKYGISHPIVNDREQELWKDLNIHAWPTLMVLGPERECLFVSSGEGKVQEIDSLVQASLEHYTLPPFLHEESTKGEKKFFPSKIGVDPLRGHFYVSDCGGHQIIVFNEKGEQMGSLGAGEAGFQDGDFQTARFCQPQGLLYHEGILYVADAGNHAIRAIDFLTEKVQTILGSGQQGMDYKGGKKGTRQHLSSPWDIALFRGQLYIAMAGTHQIWSYSLDSQIGLAFSGTGQELHFNSKDPLSASWAQPSGLSLHGTTLFVADSESSSIRSLDLVHGYTETLAGGDPENPDDLFLFGDMDGIGDKARLQHPMALLFVDELQALVIADTYNHRLKLLHPKTKTLVSWVGSGKQGLVDGPASEAQFSEPSGLAISLDRRKIYVADQNNSIVRFVDIKTGSVSSCDTT